MGEPEHMGIRLWNPHNQTTLSSPQLGPGSSQGHCALRDGWQCLETVYVFTVTGRGILASSGWRPGKLLIIPQCTGRPPQQRTIQPCGQSVSVRSPGLGIFCQSGEDGMTMFILFLKNISQDRRKRCSEWMFHSLGKAFVHSTSLHLSTSCRPGAGLGAWGFIWMQQSVSIPLPRADVLELGSRLIWYVPMGWQVLLMSDKGKCGPICKFPWRSMRQAKPRAGRFYIVASVWFIWLLFP